ncbi:MAG: hypothetical protein DRQ88_09860 [Epsilonproteobacteria bacterium]|nr:MAG: hypothetical protein DRQ89_02540 [Campylobacterota bacterium]RLA65144.1 MAG: hypothetical protein DRQ88_09860 [Campylobacterota bacterium]
MRVPPGYFFKGQFLQLIGFATLVWICFILMFQIETQQGSWLGLSSKQWFYISMATAVIHQFFVWLIWRLELCFGTITKVFKGAGFRLYTTIFSIFILSRPFTLIVLGMTDYGSLKISTGFQVTLLMLMIPPWVYAMYSIVRYFTFDRAYGIDHWHPEKYKDAGMIKKGIYKFTNHGMYFYAILILWIIAIGFKSQWALLGAFFHHVAVWIHYHATERPDIKIIYG